MVRQADVLVENFSPGVLERRGLGYAKLAEINPRLIMCSISGYGQTGPYANWPGTDPVAQAMSGLMHVTGDADGAPVYIGTAITDENASVHGLAGIAMALFARERTGRGQYIDLSLVECMFHLQDTIAAYVFSKGSIIPNRFGQHHSGLAPCGVFQARDRYVVIAVQPRQWERFVESTKIPALAAIRDFKPRLPGSSIDLPLPALSSNGCSPFPPLTFRFPSCKTMPSCARRCSILARRCAILRWRREAIDAGNRATRLRSGGAAEESLSFLPRAGGDFRPLAAPGRAQRGSDGGLLGYSRETVADLTREGVLVQAPEGPRSSCGAEGTAIPTNFDRRTHMKLANKVAVITGAGSGMGKSGGVAVCGRGCRGRGGRYQARRGGGDRE